jgi:hypothetical protein
MSGRPESCETVRIPVSAARAAPAYTRGVVADATTCEARAITWAVVGMAVGQFTMWSFSLGAHNVDSQMWMGGCTFWQRRLIVGVCASWVSAVRGDSGKRSEFERQVTRLTDGR